MMPNLEPITARCRTVNLAELMDSMMTCDDCHEYFMPEELRGCRGDGWYCNDCYRPDAWDNAEHRYRMEIEKC